MEPASVFLTVNGLKLHHLDWGNAGAPAILFIPGLTANGHAFDGTARRLCDRFHVIATDVRGRGDSAWSPDGAYLQSDYVSDLEGIVDQLNLQRFSLCGTSMGGRIAIEYAARHPERIERLIINDIGPDNEQGAVRITNNQASVPDSFADLDEALAYRRTTNPVLLTISLAEQQERVRHDFRAGDDGRLYWKNDPTWQRQRVERGTPVYPYMWELLRNLSMPTLLFWAMESDVLSEGQARKMMELLPQGEMVPVPGVGHSPTLNEPACVAGLERFLAPVPAASL